MPQFRKIQLLSLGFVIALALSIPSRAQNVYGTIAGTVTDTTGAAITDATVTLTNLATNEKHQVKSGAAGEYTFVNILPGRYRVEATKTGFKTFVREPVVVDIESGIRVDIAMQVGETTETIEVSSEAPLLQPETQSLGQVVESRTVTDMPLNGRNPLALVALVPGVVPQGAPSVGGNSSGSPVGANPFAMGDFQIGGGQAGQSAVLLDGVATNGSYLNVVTIVPDSEDIQEFKVQTNNLGPEYGRFAGGVINLTTKSGTNGFHGSGYEFLRNNVFDASGFFARTYDSTTGTTTPIAKPALTQNQFGATIGGPIIKDKLFFFSSYEGFRLRSGQTLTTTVPTALERSGDFSQSGFNIYDPNTTDTRAANQGGACASLSTTGCRTQFVTNGVANVIPTNRLDQTAVALLNYFPLPNQPGEKNNFVENFSGGGDINQINERIDYNLSEKQRIFGRFTRNSILSLPDSPFKDVCSDRCTENTVAKQIAVGDTIAISPKTILDLHAGFTRYVYVRTPLSEGIDLSQFGPNWAALAPQMAYTHLPTVCISQTPNDDLWGSGDWCSAGTGSGIGAYDGTLDVDPMLSKIFGAHTLKIGGEFRLLQNNYYQSNEPAGLFQFDGGMTAANPLVQPGVGVNGGQGVASFLLGLGSNVNTNSNVTTPGKMAEEIKYYAFYAGDTWQATRKLTLNLGVRADIQGDWTERYDRQVVFLPDAASPIAGAVGMPGLKGEFAVVHSPLFGNRSPFGPWKNIAPRIGFSYQLDSNTVIRSGYGMFYLPVDVRWDDAPHNLFTNSYSQPWLATTSVNGVPVPLNPLSNPFPGGIIQPMYRNQTLIDEQGSGIGAALDNFPPPYVQQWNLDIQRQLPGDSLIDVAYAGSKGTNLPAHSQDLDQMPLQDLPQGGPSQTNTNIVNALTASIPNPFCAAPCGTGPVVSGGVGSDANIPAGRLLLPYPQFDDVSMEEPDNRDSIYHSLQMKFQKRFSAGASILASYTVSKLIDDTNSEINWLETASPQWGDSNAYNLRGERSLDGFDVPQRFVLSGVLDMPVGKGKKFGGNMSPVADKVLGGWGIAPIITFQSGFPLSMGCSGAYGLLGSSGIPNVGCPRLTVVGNRGNTSGSLDAKLAQWFNTSAYAFTNNYGYGSDGRTEPNVRADGIKNFDFTATKDTKFGPDDRLTLQFRADFFNIFNRTQFNAPNTSFGSPNFGQVTAQYNL
ncbi:MAG TPA: carboxypeptidase-like regulatory domain-containing protein, partial [Terriglobales bacterium]|nr:carboxypeptidase-like regulatory domain-containing protein [Terriglobales bacterium]